MGNRKGFGNLKPRIGGNDSLKLEEIVDIMRFPKDEWLNVRFLDEDFLPVKRHWVKIVAGKEKKEVKVPRFCVSFDPENESVPLEGVNCPYCELTSGKDGSVQHENFYLLNAIIRDLQEEEPAKRGKPTSEERKTGKKDIRSKTWTPVRPLRVPPTLAARIQELGENNIVKNKKKGTKKAFDVTHPKFGCDIMIKFKPNAPGTDKYSADKGDRSPLTDEEQEYLVWDLKVEILDAAGRLTPEQAVDDFKKMEVVGGESFDEDDDDDDDDDDDLDLSSRSKKGKKKKRPSFDDDDDDDEDDEDEDDDDDEQPRKKKSKSKSVKGKKSKPKKKKRPSFDDDEDDDDEDEDEDEPPRKKKSKSKSVKGKKKKRPSFDDDDEDEDEPPRKKKSKSKSKSVKGKKSKPKKTAWDDDDDDDDWDD